MSHYVENFRRNGTTFSKFEVLFPLCRRPITSNFRRNRTKITFGVMGQKSLSALWDVGVMGVDAMGTLRLEWPKMTILDQYFQKYLSLSVQTCLKVRFYQVLHVSVSFMCRNVQILKIWAKNGQKSPFFTKTRFSQNHLKWMFSFKN